MGWAKDSSLLPNKSASGFVTAGLLPGISRAPGAYLDLLLGKCFRPSDPPIYCTGWSELIPSVSWVELGALGVYSPKMGLEPDISCILGYVVLLGICVFVLLPNVPWSALWLPLLWPLLSNYIAFLSAYVALIIFSFLFASQLLIALLQK